MCVVSLIGDHYRDEFERNTYKPWVQSPVTHIPESGNDNLQKQINDLRKQVEEMKRFLKEAIEYDRKANQPHCENQQKIEFLRQVAKSVGVTLEDVFPTEPTPPPSRTIKEHKAPKKRS